MSRKHRLDQRKLCMKEALAFYGTFRVKTEIKTADLNDMFPILITDIDTIPLTTTVSFSVSASFNEPLHISIPFTLNSSFTRASFY